MAATGQPSPAQPRTAETKRGSGDSPVPATPHRAARRREEDAQFKYFGGNTQGTMDDNNITI